VGIRVAAGCEKNRVWCNNCSDEQIHPTQTIGVLEAEGTKENDIHFNVTCPLHVHPERTVADTLESHGERTSAADNVTQTEVPSGSSLEARKKNAKTAP